MNEHQSHFDVKRGKKKKKTIVLQQRYSLLISNYLNTDTQKRTHETNKKRTNVKMYSRLMAN